MFLDDDFLLTTQTARELYHGYAEKQPIIDYHCHLDPAAIAADVRFQDLAQLWICDNGAGDHYKWRLMRANGVPERLITGDGDPFDKFCAYAATLERAIGNPLYEWSHLELRRVFGIRERICMNNAPIIWDKANARIAEQDFSARSLIRSFDVRCICTTDDPASDLAHHRQLAAEEDACGFKVLPTFRPDALMAVDAPGFCAYAERLSAESGIAVNSWETLKAAAAQRVAFFHQNGCRLADHGMNSFVFCPATDAEAEEVVGRALAGRAVNAAETMALQGALTLFLMDAYASHGWTLQIHANCMRNVSASGFSALGADAGFDTVGVQPDIVRQLCLMLDAAQANGGLPKLILYSLNEADWMALATLAGCFQGGGFSPRVQFGNAWWFNDTANGIERQLTILAEQGLLGNFTGMLTDSRSFLSYPRHEYFRRVLCKTVGAWVDAGRLPDDMDYLGGIVAGICHGNASRYFGFFD